MPIRPIQAVRDLSAPWHTTGIGQAAALALTIAAFTWTVIGAGILAGVSRAPVSVLIGLPVWLRVALWWIPALLAVVVLLVRRHAAIVCGLLIFAPALRMSSHLWAWWMHLAGDPCGYAVGWYGAATQVPLLALIILLALLTRMARSEEVIN